MHTFSLRVYYSDTDCGGIVYHGRYLDFAEHARTEMLREISVSDKTLGSQSSLMETQNIAFVVKSILIDYQKLGKLDDLLCVETEVEEAKRFSLTFLQTIKRGEEVLCVLHVKVASINMDTHRPTLLPAYVIESL